MAPQLFDLAMDLAKLAPHTLPKCSKLLEEQLSDAQKNTLRNTLPSTESEYRAPPLAQPGTRSGPVLKFVSGPVASIRRPALYTNRPVFANPEVQALLAATRIIPPEQVKAALLTVAKERQREARVIFYFVCAFFSLCLLILILGIVFLFLKNATSVGESLTILGTLLSGVGGILAKAHRHTNKSLDTIIEKIQRA